MPEQAANGPEGKKRHRSTVSLTASMDKSRWSTPCPRKLYPKGREPIPFAQEVVCAPGQVWTDAENHTLRRIRCSYRSGRSESLYRLLYRLNKFEMTYITIG
jgi:hypothetical protein